MSIELLRRAAEAARTASNNLHYLYNEQSWGHAPEDVFARTIGQYARKTRQQFLFERAVRDRSGKSRS